MDGLFTGEALSAFVTVLMADLVLAGDNALVVGMAAAGLPPALRQRAILIGIAAATILRILFAAVAVQLLAIIGLTLAGGLLLLWVAWKLWRDLRSGHAETASAEDDASTAPATASVAATDRAAFRSALTKIIIADVSMSLDNVLAVAGAARDHLWVLVAGLAISVMLTGLASTLIARLLGRYRWIAYFGLVMIAYVATRMIWDGSHEILREVQALS